MRLSGPFLIVAIALLSESSDARVARVSKIHRVDKSINPITRSSNQNLFSRTDVIVDIQDQDKNQYHEQDCDNSKCGQYVYGYDVGPNGQFHHEVRGPDGVTYGCYGYLDPNNELRATHYVADAWGFRVIIPGKPVDVWRKKPGTTDEYEMETIPYEQAHFPKGCGTGPGGTLPGDGATRLCRT